MNTLMIQGFLIAAVVAMASPLRAQSPNLEVGGTLVDSPLPGGGRWAWIFWNSDDPSAFLRGPLAGSGFAVHEKSGGPDSPNPYRLAARMRLQGDARTIQALIERSRHAGQSVVALESTLRSFLNDVPQEADAPDLGLADKLTVLLSGALEDQQMAADLAMMATTHPAVQLVRGHAVLLPIGPEKRTYEIRLADDGNERAVVGRVTLDGAGPIPQLPAPGVPWFVPEKAETAETGLGNVSEETLNRHRQVLQDRTLDRIARLRWATPEPLLRVSTHHQGYNLYRVDAAYAESVGWTAPGQSPPPELLRAAAEDDAIPEVSQVLPGGPILPDLTLTPAEAADPDSDHAFIVDDRRLLLEGDPDEEAIRDAPFENGTQFRYFVTARDVLGRDGLVSPPSEVVTMATRRPPAPVIGVRTENVYEQRGDAERSGQRLRIHWEHTRPGDDSDRPLRYHVFRWATADASHRWLSDLDVGYLGTDGRFYGRVTPQPLEFGPDEEPSFLDESLDAPDETIPRKVFWYTIVAVDQATPEVQNLSPHSAPVDAIIREWTGPGAPDARVTLAAFAPGILPGTAASLPLPEVERDAGYIQLRLVCTRPVARFIDWVEYFIAGESSGRIHFARGQTTLEWIQALSPAEVDQLLSYADGPLITARAGSNLNENALSAIVGITNEAALAGMLSAKYPDIMTRVTFETEILSKFVSLPGDPSPYVALPENPVTGEVYTPRGEIDRAEGMVQWRIYRSIDESEPMLVSSGYFDELYTPGQVVQWTEGIIDNGIPQGDAGPPPGGGRICYQIQTLDMDGNPSPFTIRCFTMPPLGAALGESTPLDPVIESLDPVEDADGEPRLRLRWSAGVTAETSFTITFYDGSDEPPHIAGVAGLSVNHVPDGVTTLPDVGRGAIHSIPAVFVRRPNGTGGFFEDLFELSFPVVPGRDYTVQVHASVEARGAGRSLHGRSEPATARWTSPRDPAVNPDDVLPWTQRKSDWRERFIDGIHARFIQSNGFSGNAVRIGSLRTNAQWGLMPWSPEPVFFLSERRLSSDLLFHTRPVLGTKDKRLRKTALPCMLYRYRVPAGSTGDDLASRKADFVQVTPLIEEIALQQAADDNGNPRTVVRDPFLRVVASPADPKVLDVYLIDRHPVIRGERYRYVLVRFDENKEIDFVHPVASVATDLSPAPAVTVPTP
jgi:hypothetical protein